MGVCKHPSGVWGDADNFDSHLFNKLSYLLRLMRHVQQHVMMALFRLRGCFPRSSIVHISSIDLCWKINEDGIIKLLLDRFAFLQVFKWQQACQTLKQFLKLNARYVSNKNRRYLYCKPSNNSAKEVHG